MREIEGAAQDFTQAIVCEYRIFVDNLLAAQNDPPLILFLSEIEATPTQVTGRATRADVVNAEFPRRLYRVREFPGLKR
jgi:hypothetical protein